MDRLSTQWDLDERIPPQFHQTANTLIETLIKPDRLKRDLFFALLLILMKENNFRLIKGKQGGPTDVIDYIQSNKDKNIDVYEAVFRLDYFDETPIKIVASPIANILLVNAVTDVSSDVYSLCLPFDKYITDTKLGSPALSQLDELNILFKDQIITPMKNLIRNYHNYIYSDIRCFPENVIIDILINLPIRDILNLSEACKRVYEILSDDHVWRKLCERELFTPKSDYSTWHDFFVKSYLAEKEKHKADEFDDISLQPMVINNEYDLDII